MTMQEALATFTDEFQYDDPFRFVIDIYDAKEEELIYTYDSFASEGSRPFSLTDIICSSGFLETGSFQFQVNDTKDRVFSDVTKKKIKNEYVAVIKGGKAKSRLKNLCHGYIEEIRQTTNRHKNILYNFGGPSSTIVFSYTQARYNKKTSVQNIGTLNPIISEDFRVKNLFFNALNTTDSLLEENALTLRERGNFDLTLIQSQGVKDFMNVVDYTGSFAGLAAIFANATGGIFGVDADKKVRLQLPRLEHSGITFKGWNPNIKDLAASTSYFFQSLSRVITTSTNDGFYQKLFMTIEAETTPTVSPGDTTSLFTDLSEKDIVQQIKLGAGGLPNMKLLLQKTGTGRSDAENQLDIKGLRGAITTNQIDQQTGLHSPTGAVVATFVIPFDDIPDTPTVISKIPLSYRISQLNPSELYWLHLFKTGIEPDNTINVFHDGDFDTESTDEVPRRSGTKRPPVQPNYEDTNFANGYAISVKGPVYRYAFFDTAKVEMVFKDALSIRALNPKRPKEIRITAPFIKDIQTAQLYGDAILSYSSKPKELYDEVLVSIPDQGIFPMTTAQVVFPLFNITENNATDVEINHVTYEAHGGDLESPLGAAFARCRFTAYPNPTLEISDADFLDVFDRNDSCTII